MMGCYPKTIGQVKTKCMIFKWNLIWHTIVKSEFLAVKLIWINMFEIIIYHWKSPPFKRIILLFHKQIRAKPCISSIPQELHIINTQCCISSSRRGMHADAWWDTAPKGLMIYTTASWWYAKPAAWIKKEVTFGRQKLLLFLAEKEGYSVPLSRWPSLTVPNVSTRARDFTDRAALRLGCFDEKVRIPWFLTKTNKDLA